MIFYPSSWIIILITNHNHRTFPHIYSAPHSYSLYKPCQFPPSLVGPRASSHWIKFSWTSSSILRQRRTGEREKGMGKANPMAAVNNLAFLPNRISPRPSTHGSSTHTHQFSTKTSALTPRDGPSKLYYFFWNQNSHQNCNLFLVKPEFTPEL
jgi:hypothetical protein